MSTRGPVVPAGRPVRAEKGSGVTVRLRGRLALAALVTAAMAASWLITGFVGVAPHDSDSSSAAGSHRHITMLPAEAMAPAPPPSLRTGWTVSASDEEISGENGQAANVLDGNAASFWQSKGPSPAVPLPHTITIDTKETHSISGFRYLPRSDVPNGRVGSFEILVSTNGTTWTAPVARGTWADSSAEKSVTFTAVSARYVQLRAITEAGNRGPWSSAAEINLLAQSSDMVMAPQQASGSLGSWGPTINFPIVPAAAALLPGNKLLTWSAYSATQAGTRKGYTQTSILNLTTGAVTQTQVANTGHDMFCPGTSLLPDGKIMISGGSNSSKTTLYNPGTNTWTAGPDMKIPRGYQSNVTISTGEVFTLGGSWSGGIGNKNGEVWSAAGGWRTLPNVLSDNILTDDPRGEYTADNHAWLFAAPGGRVFHAGPSRQMNWISTTGNGSISSAGLRSDSPDAMNANAVMYDVGKILTVGGATAYNRAPGTARAYTIDINNGVKVTRTADLAFARSFANGVALPDGQVFVVGGQATASSFNDTTARMAPEIWNPATGQWTTLAPMAIPRTYHSVALLLPDGRVFAGGGGLCGDCTTNHLDGEIFTPPYLLNADGSARTRPTIVTAPATAAAGGTIAVTTGAPVTKFSLMRMSTVTHSVNTDQRRIPLTATSVSGNTASLKLPADPGVLVPGKYLLFAMDGNGVPSVASTIQIGSQHQASSAITARSSTTANASTANTTVALAAPAGRTAGDVLVASFTADQNPTVAVPAGWKTIVNGLSIASSSTAGARVFAYYRVVGASDPATYTWTLSRAVTWGGGVTAYRGVNNTTPLDSAVATAVNASYTASSITVPSITTVSNGAMQIGGVGFDSPYPGAYPPTRWTERWEAAGGQIAEHAAWTKATAGATGTATWTFSTAKAVAAWRTALKPAS
ncbi:galactose oxidase-like domain-containing protein [Arthrobacter pascens]|uniref:galactose oxidase-like domain-containing protein n=1 Tax=Arthrobacter pascens TaxID=1677 RepID=UPI0027D80B62|nr:galactose oxidase-like domain-containing protein [Arthrobacter pascens]